MDIALHARVDGTDGELGRVENMIVNPKARRVTHLVVRAAKSPNALRLVPEKYVKSAVHDLAVLSIDGKKFHGLREFLQTDYLSPGLFLRLAKEERAHLPVAPASWEVEREVAPEGSAILRPHAPVLATDGKAGTVDEYLVERRTGRITHLILREGHLWGKREIHIPASLVAGYGDDGVRLSVDKRAVELLPLIDPS